MGASVFMKPLKLGTHIAALGYLTGKLRSGNVTAEDLQACEALEKDTLPVLEYLKTDEYQQTIRLFLSELKRFKGGKGRAAIMIRKTCPICRHTYYLGPDEERTGLQAGLFRCPICEKEYTPRKKKDPLANLNIGDGSDGYFF